MAFAAALFCAACGGEDYGTLTIADIENLEVGKTAAIEPVFSKEEFTEEITYSFTGDAIAIEDGTVTALEGGATVRVTATTEHHETTFKVTTAEEKVYGTFTVEDVIGLPAGSSADLQIEFTPRGNGRKNILSVFGQRHHHRRRARHRDQPEQDGRSDRKDGTLPDDVYGNDGFVRPCCARRNGLGGIPRERAARIVVRRGRSI